MNKRNYQRELDEKIEQMMKEGIVKKLLLHSCCAPCSSYCLEYLSQYFEITVLYYNPNIFPETEYQYRISEQQRLIEALPAVHPISFRSLIYSPEEFYQAARGMENEPEGGERCKACFRLRLERTAKMAREEDFDFFTTTLSISPLKNATVLNTIGEELAEKYGVSYLNSDFKKRNGYKRSVELSAKYGLYRQDYCGCEYSRRDL